VPEVLTVENLTKQYSGTLAVDDISFHVTQNEIVGLLGPNGAGKSTLIKLLCRFYDPDAGRVALDGIDLRDLPLEDLRQMITVLFQEPVHYHGSVVDNIAPGPLAQGRDQAAIREAAEAAGADETIAALPAGYETVLGKWLAPGAELSVGEWQRIGLARAFLRPAPILLLDEPTSAMDSWAEADWLARFRALAAGRTVVIITHRFTTAMRADIIHVLDQGQVVESGTHRELLAQGGRYAQSWEAQMTTA
jgi:ATP-binding cassette subfamily B protein